MSQVLRGKKGKRYHEAMFSDEGYVSNAAGTYKYKLFEEEYTGLDAKGKREIRKRKVLIYWDEKDARMAGKKREEKLAKARRVDCALLAERIARALPQPIAAAVKEESF